VPADNKATYFSCLLPLSRRLLELEGEKGNKPLGGVVATHGRTFSRIGHKLAAS
jgi:hypothetical protein